MSSQTLSSRIFSATCLTLTAAGLSTQTYAQPYTTVINVPPDIAPAWIDSDTQLNLADGGIIGDDSFDAGAADGSSTNVAVNITGGSMGNGFNAYAGSTTYQSGGSIGWWFRAHTGSTLTQVGGTIGPLFTIKAGSTVNLSGGRVGWEFKAESGSAMNLLGGEFLLDGIPVPGLVNPGDSAAVNLPEGSRLTGTLEDGSVFVFDTSPYTRDLIADGVLTLTQSTLPTKPTVIDTPLAPVPRGLRAGQTLNLNTGASLGDYFTAVDATLNLDGGIVGEGLEVVGTTVNMTSGTIGEKHEFNAYTGSTVNVSGGSIGGLLFMTGSSTAHISGSAFVESAWAGIGSTVNVGGGTLERLVVSEGGTINYSGGKLVNRLHAAGGGTMNILGGEFELDGVPIPGLASPGDTVQIDVTPGSVLTGTLADGTVLVLTDLERNPNDRDNLVDGVVHLTNAPLPAVAPVINVPTDPDPEQLRAGQTLYLGPGGHLAERFTSVNGTLILGAGTVGDYAEVASSAVTINGTAVGAYFDVKANSSVHLHGGSIGDRLDLNSGSTMYMTGGSVGEFTRVGDPDGTGTPAFLNISGGEAGDTMSIFSNGTLNVTGGTLGNGLDAGDGSVVAIAGGTVGDGVDAFPGSTVTITGGTVGDNFKTWGNSNVTISGGFVDGRINVLDDAVLKIDGGEVKYLTIEDGATIDLSGGVVTDDFSIEPNGTLNLFGGEINRLSASSGSRVAITGRSFVLDGVDLTPQMNIGEPITINLRDVPLEGVLDDGSSFGFDLNSIEILYWVGISSNYFAPNMLLTITRSPLPGDLNGDGFVGIQDLNIVLSTWNQNVSPGDLLSGDATGDGFVGIEDLNQIISHWNGAFPPGLTATIPEPGSVLFFGVFSGLFVCGRGRGWLKW